MGGVFVNDFKGNELHTHRRCRLLLSVDILIKFLMIAAQKDNVVMSEHALLRLNTCTCSCVCTYKRRVVRRARACACCKAPCAGSCLLSAVVAAVRLHKIKANKKQ